MAKRIEKLRTSKEILLNSDLFNTVSKINELIDWTHAHNDSLKPEEQSNYVVNKDLSLNTQESKCCAECFGSYYDKKKVACYQCPCHQPKASEECKHEWKGTPGRESLLKCVKCQKEEWVWHHYQESISNFNKFLELETWETRFDEEIGKWLRLKFHEIVISYIKDFIKSLLASQRSKIVKMLLGMTTGKHGNLFNGDDVYDRGLYDAIKELNKLK